MGWAPEANRRVPLTGRRFSMPGPARPSEPQRTMSLASYTSNAYSQDGVQAPLDLGYIVNLETNIMDELAEDPDMDAFLAAPDLPDRVTSLWDLRRYAAGTMPQLYTWVDDSGFRSLALLDACLRSIGLTVFMNNPISGLCILLGLLIHSPSHALLGLVGVVGATGAAHCMDVDTAAVRNGTFGYNGFRIGLALAVLHLGADWALGSLPWLVLPALVLGGASSYLMAATLKCAGEMFGLPPLDASFVVCTYMWAAACSGLGSPAEGTLSYFPINGNTISPALNHNSMSYQPPAAQSYTAAGLAHGFGASLSQCLLADGVLPGVLLLVGVAVCSPLAAGMALYGAALSILFQVAFGVGESAMVTGMVSFNCVLASIALGGFFVILKGRRVWVIVTTGIFLAFLTSAGLCQGLSVAGLPAFYVPSTASIWLMLFCSRGVAGLVVMPLALVTIHEDHRSLFEELEGAGQEAEALASEGESQTGDGSWAGASESSGGAYAGGLEAEPVAAAAKAKAASEASEGGFSDLSEGSYRGGEEGAGRRSTPEGGFSDLSEGSYRGEGHDVAVAVGEWDADGRSEASSL